MFFIYLLVIYLLENNDKSHYIAFDKIHIFLAERLALDMREYFEDVIIKFNSGDITENCLKCKFPYL